MTINEIAKLAGVSSAAVSRYLNNGYVGDEKREAIKKVIEDTGYRPSLQAQVLRTKDGGIGMLQALGYGILDKDGAPVSRYGKGLADIAQITDDHVIQELSQCTFKIACDVTNPLCGENGCSAIYRPQKGATAEMIQNMDGWLAHFADYVKDADIVVTGEGRLDGQTVMGKAPIDVAQTAKKFGKPVLGFAGCVTKDAVACNAGGIDAFFRILQSVVTLEEAMSAENARYNMAATVEQVFRVVVTIASEGSLLYNDYCEKQKL